MKHLFFGGIFPAPHKESTRRKPLARLSAPPEQVVLPLLDAAGRLARPMVRPGETVTLGQPVAVWEELSLPIHASVSGRVAAIEARAHPLQGSAPAIVLDSDGQNTPWANCPAPLDPEQITPEVLVDRVRLAGIVGMGGSASPTWQKLEEAVGRVDTLILNAAECEPYITADHRLLLERSEPILKCAQVLSRCLGAKRAILVTEGDKLNAAEALERRLRKQKSNLQLCTVPTRYPLGAEKQVIQTATGREVPHGSAPVDIGCLVLNIATVFAIHNALFRGRSLTHRAVTVSGGAVTRPRNLWVPMGTPLARLLEECSGLKEEAPLFLTGGPMMGTPLTDLNAPVLPTTNSLLALVPWEVRGKEEESVCLRCGKCVSACPMHLTPTYVRRALRRGNLTQLAKLHVEDCIGCGCCSYICPAHIPLVELTAQARDVLKKEGLLK